MAQENEKLYGSLFGSIDILSEEHLEIILSTMDKGSANYFIVEALKAAHRGKAFTIVEIEVISRAIRTISRED